MDDLSWLLLSGHWLSTLHSTVGAATPSRRETLAGPVREQPHLVLVPKSACTGDGTPRQAGRPRSRPPASGLSRARKSRSEPELFTNPKTTRVVRFGNNAEQGVRRQVKRCAGR